MWKEISTEIQLQNFMKDVNFFHDSCLKEIRYISGAYVDKDLCMHPINDRRVLRVIIQRQSDHMPVIELEFRGLKYLKLYPIDESYTCEILASTMFFKDSYIYWCDSEHLAEEFYEGTLICASRLLWRATGNLGDCSMFQCK